jgi:uncharacterized protein YbjT (DUF2867 family)
MYKVIVTGATGMVGEGVLHECLNSPLISEVMIINRRASGCSNPKLKEIIHTDFHDLSAVESMLKGYDACFFCLGVSSVGMNKEMYRHMTYDLTMHFAQTVVKLNPSMVFCYVSGAGTDSTGKGRLAWARVKGEVENDLMRLPFKAVYNFRPAMIEPTPGLSNTIKVYTYFGWLIPVLNRFFPKSICRLEQVGQAMISALVRGYSRSVVEVEDIKTLAANV